MRRPDDQEEWQLGGDSYQDRLSRLAYLGEDGRLPRDLRRFQLYTEGELEAAPIEWLVPGFLAAKELTLAYGAGDTWKTFHAVDASCRIAADGREVIIVAAEGGRGIRRRIAAWRVHHGFTDPLPTLHVLPASFRMHVEREVSDWLHAMLMQLDATPELVVVDTLARNFVGGNENDAKDMGQFVDGCEAIRAGLSTAVEVIHHTTKDGKTERGTEALRNAAFAAFKYTRSNSAVTVECDRMKETEKPLPVEFVARLVELPDLSQSSSLVLVPRAPSGERVKVIDKRHKFRAAVEAMLREQGPLGENKLAEALRKQGVKVPREAPEWLREWAADPDDKLVRGDAGGYSI